MVRNNLFSLLQQAEKLNNKKYSWALIGRRVGRSRQAAEKLFRDEQTNDSYIKYGTLDGLLKFFNAEGLPVTISDLFIVSSD